MARLSARILNEIQALQQLILNNRVSVQTFRSTAEGGSYQQVKRGGGAIAKIPLADSQNSVSRTGRFR
jgi:hypothetical protein